MQGSACTDLSSAEPINRVAMVREFREQANCSLKVAMDAVNNGWRPGDPIPHDAVQKAQQEYDAWHRLRDAAPDLLKVLEPQVLDGVADKLEKSGWMGASPLVSILRVHATAQRAAIALATGSEAK